MTVMDTTIITTMTLNIYDDTTFNFSGRSQILLLSSALLGISGTYIYNSVYTSMYICCYMLKFGNDTCVTRTTMPQMV